MAILEDQRTEVVVFVDGQPAREYDNDDDTELDTERSVTKYVEVVSGKEFSFTVFLQPGFTWGRADTIVARPSIDGKQLTGICLAKSKGFRELTGMSGLITGEWSGSGSNAQLFKFAFTDLQTRRS